MIKGWIALGVLAAGLTVLPGGALAKESPSQTQLSPVVKAFLIAALKPNFDAAAEAESPTRITSAELPLSDGRKDIIVYITGRQWCGSGGCNMMILEPTGGSFKVIADTSITWTPIRLLPTASHGHPDISVFVHGGGILPGYQARLRFDGRSYPSNPTVASAVRMKTRSEGQLLIGQDEGELLYK